MRSRGGWICLALLIGLALPARAQMPSGAFADVPTSHWSYGIVHRLEGGGYFSGYPAGTFRGQQKVSRYDFAVALERMAAEATKRVSQVVDGSARPATAPTHAAVAAEVADLRRLAEEYSGDFGMLGIDLEAVQRQLQTLTERLARVKPTGTPATPPDRLPDGGFSEQNPLAGLRGPRPRILGDLGNSPFSSDAATSRLPLVGGLGLTLGTKKPDPLNGAPDLRLEDPAAQLALEAQLQLLLGDARLAGYYKRFGANYTPMELRALLNHGLDPRGLEGYGGALVAPINRRLLLSLEGAQYDEDAGLPGSVRYLRGGLSLALTERLTLDLGYEQLRYAMEGQRSDVEEYYNIGLGRRLSPSASFRFIYLIPNLRGGDPNDPSSTLFDWRSHAALTQFLVRF